MNADSTALEPLLEPLSAQAEAAFAQQDYRLAARLYEQALEQHPTHHQLCWHLGLALLLQGQEEDAQATWFMAMAMGEADQIEVWTAELAQILTQEAQHQEQIGAYRTAWMIRCHQQEILPTADNLLNIVELLGQQHELTADALQDLDALGVLHQSPVGTINSDNLLRTLEQVLAMEPHPIMVEFMTVALPHISAVADLVPVLLPATTGFAYTRRVPQLAAELVEVVLTRDPNHVELLGHLAAFYQTNRDYDRGIAAARRRLTLTKDLAEKIFASHLLLRGLMAAGGYWQEALEAMAQHCQLLEELFQTQAQLVAQPLHRVHTMRLFSTASFQPYFGDRLAENRHLQNQLAQVCQANIRASAADTVARFQQGLGQRRSRQTADKILNIGYVSHCMTKHSVGWLARWLIQHHDRSQFRIHGYFYKDRQNDALFDWYLNHVDSGCRMGVECADNSLALAERIYQDEIDILVDLDSVTIDIGCELLSVKPAPIQVTWLGWDASGLEAIDYFLADRYVLPDTAQDHYVEKIWRLPHSYLCVDGFEVGVPTLRRDELDIPANAVVYLSAQTGYKRHPDTIRLQLEIIKQVPNGYFLVKGLGNETSTQALFLDLAAAVGVARDRLRFLPIVDSEATHRANLSIADVVLDTFPYNGATTTMETLWMGIPLVTRVGQQFASRNSYTMLKNAGIDAGIAWSDAEYVEWGVRLGQDAALREDIAWQLKRSRQTASLWNAKAFTRDVEAAYQQMWQIYLQGAASP
jgi:predicted O-linked N-acetylglucosamine transferase (SPINDLY family)